MYFREKFSQCQKKLKGGPFGIFQHPFCCKTSKKCRGDTLGKNFPKKMSRSAEKNWKGDSLVSPGMLCYAEKQVKPFWSSSLGQMVHFDTIIIYRTCKNYFGQFVWIEKKRVTTIVAFHFMKRRLKNLSGDQIQTQTDNNLLPLNFEMWPPGQIAKVELSLELFSALHLNWKSTWCSG